MLSGRVAELRVQGGEKWLSLHWQGGAGHGRSPNKLTREDFRAGGEIKQPWFVENEEHLGGAELITPSSLETKDLYNHSSLLPFSPVPS